MYEVALTLETVITVAYWSVILPFDLKYRKSKCPSYSATVLYLMFALHSLPVLCLLADFKVNRVRFHLRRAVFPLGLITLYAIFNIGNYCPTKPILFP